jgi:hypothetical protein
MLLLSVFLRPVLMIIGLIGGMILSKVVLRFLNYGFFGVLQQIPNLGLFSWLAIQFIYCTLLVTVVTQAFSLVYLIPDRVMRWLGVSEQSSGAQEALQSSKHGYEQMSGAAEKVGGSITQGGGDVLSKGAERKRKHKARRDTRVQPN